MSYFAFALAPVSGEQPCGPDLEGDAGFETLVTVAEGKLPASFFEFKRNDFDLAAELQPVTALLKQSRDLRLLVVAAKFAALAGNISIFCDAILAMTELLQNHWEHVHPAGSETAIRHREAHLSSLDDAPTVIVPLQYAVLVTDRRHGAVSYRSQLVASKAIAARKGEAVLDEGQVREALLKADDFDGIKAVLQLLAAAEAALKQIRALFIEHAGHETTPAFEKLLPLITAIATFLTNVLKERDPSLLPDTAPATAETGAETATIGSDAHPSAIVINATGEASAALTAIAAYFNQNEPSNPAAMLVRQAWQLVGKSFIDAMVILNPALAEKASIKIGGATPLALTSGQMKALSEQAAAPTAVTPPPDPPVIATRGSADAYMAAVESYFQKSEPSSPIPMLLRRARSYSGKDFSELMKDMLG